MKNALQNRPHCRHANCIGRYHPIKGGHRCSRCDDEVGEDFKPLPMTHDKVEQSLLPVTQAHRDAAAEWLGSPDGGAGTLRIGKIIAGNFDGHPLVQAFARFERDILARHRGSTAVDAEYFASLLSSATEAAKVAEVCAFLAAKYDGIGNAAIANGHSPKAHRISKAYEGHLNRIRDALGNIAALASLSTTPAAAMDETQRLGQEYDGEEMEGPFHVSRSSDGEKHWFSVRDPAAGVIIPAKDRNDAYALVSSLNRCCTVFARRARSAPTPDRIGKDAVRERVGILEAALWSVLSYDQLLRQYSGPQAILFAGDVANIDATYDAMVAKVTAALSATPTQPVDETERWRPIETCPQEDLFIGAVHVRDNRSGAEWWERHLLALDDETGEIHADYEQGWELSAYSWWLPFSTPPIPATDKGEVSRDA